VPWPLDDLWPKSSGSPRGDPLLLDPHALLFDRRVLISDPANRTFITRLGGAASWTVWVRLTASAETTRPTVARRLSVDVG
jgi:hypothetical protein